MLHNFAGNIEMYGVLDAVGLGPVEARISDNSTMASLIVLVLGFHSVYYCVRLHNYKEVAPFFDIRYPSLVRIFEQCG